MMFTMVGHAQPADTLFIWPDLLKDWLDRMVVDGSKEK